MEIRDLRYFILVADLCSIGKAAEKAGLSQPAVTKSVQRLESGMGAELFEKNGHRMTLSPVGAVLYERAVRIVQDIDSAYQDVLAAASGLTGHVRIGVSAGAAEFVLPDYSVELLNRYPDVTLEIKVGMSDALVADLKARTVDFVIGMSSTTDPELAFEQMNEDRVVVVAGVTHPLLEKPAPLGVQDLAGYRWLLPSRATHNRRWLDGVFTAAGLPAPVAQVESNDLMLTPRLISDSHLLSFISRKNLALETLRSRVVELDVPEAVMSRKFGVLRLKDGYLSPTSRVAIEMVLERQPG